MPIPWVRVLGPLEVRRDGRPVAVGGSRARRVLVLLMAEPHGAIRMDALADAVWDGAPPASWRNTLQSYLSRIRSSSGLHIDRQGDAYVLDRASCVIDADEFSARREIGLSAAEDGRWGEAAHELDAALELWSGPAFDGYDDLDAVRPVAARLEEQRLDTVEGLVEAHLTNGSATSALDASSAVRVGPCGRERLTCLRATALHRCGRVAEALRELSAYRRRLVDETGLHPTPAVAELEQRILHERPLVDEPGRLPVELDRLRNLPLVGRSGELDTARRTWRIVASGGFAATFLVGDAGAGKTRLAAEIANVVLCNGGAVRYGRATERLDAAHHSFAHALRDVPPTVLDGVGPLAPELVGVIPHLVAHGPKHNRLDDDDVHVTRFHEALTRLVGTVAGEQPCLLVLDDVQWSSSATVAAIEHLVTVGRPRGLLLLVTVRTGAATSTLDLTAELERRGDATVVDVAPLDEASMTALFATRELVLDDVLAQRVHRATGGNALLGSELASSVESVDDLWRRTNEAGAHVPSAVAALVESRKRRLSDGGDALEWAALIGLEFDLPVLEEASGGVADLDHVEEAARFGLTREVAAGRWEFCHALTRDAIVDRLSGTRAARHHRAIARALETLRPPGDLLGRTAYHWCEGADRECIDQAVDSSIAAARLRVQQLGPEEARRHVGRAIAAAAAVGGVDDVRLATLHLLDARACDMVIDNDGRIAAAERAFRHAIDAGDRQLVSEAALLRNAFWTQGHLDRAALDRLTTAIDLVGDDRRARSQLLASLAGMVAVSGADRDESGHDAVDAAETALALAEDLDDPEPWLSAASSLVVALWARPAAARQCELAAQMPWRGGTEGPLSAARWGAAPALVLGDRRAFEEATGQLREIGDGEGLDLLRAYGHQGACLSALLDGRFDDAAESGALAVSLARGHPNFTRVHLAQTFWIAAETDTLEPLVPAARAVAADSGGLPVFDAMLGLILAGTGEYGGARELLDGLAVNGFEAVPRDVLWTATVAACAELTAALHVPEYAAPLQRLLEPYRGQFIVVAGGAFVYGAVDRFLALLASSVGDDRAAGLFAGAATAERQLESAPLEARTLVWWLRTLGDDSGAIRQRLDDLCRRGDLPWAAAAVGGADLWTPGATVHRVVDS